MEAWDNKSDRLDVPKAHSDGVFVDASVRDLAETEMRFLYWAQLIMIIATS